MSSWPNMATRWPWWQPICACLGWTASSSSGPVHALHRSCSRVLLVAMDRFHTTFPLAELSALQRATALGRIDFSVVKGWATPEESLYPQVQETLTSWTMANGPRHVVHRLVGEQWGPRSHVLRVMLSRNGVPFAFYPADSPDGRQLASDHGIDMERLAAVIGHDGAVLQDPSFSEIAAAHGIRTRPSSEVYDLAVVGAGPAGLAAAVYGPGPVSSWDGRRRSALRLAACEEQRLLTRIVWMHVRRPRSVSRPPR